MEIIKVFLLVVEAICCLLLIGIILLQKSKSEGMGMAFGAQVGETLFGSRAGNVLTRGTIILASIFLINTLILGILYSGNQKSPIDRELATGRTPVAETNRNPPAPDRETTTLPETKPGDESASPAQPAPEQPGTADVPSEVAPE